MASGVYNEGAESLGDGTIDFLTDGAIKIMLLLSSYTFDKDHAAVTTLAASEVTVGGYVGGFAGAGRKALGSKTVAKNDSTDRVVFDAADPTAWTLATGETVGGAAIIRENTNDAGSTPLFFLDFTDTPTNGGTFTVSFDALGMAYLQQ
jgi:hypothetical protein